VTAVRGTTLAFSLADARIGRPKTIHRRTIMAQQPNKDKDAGARSSSAGPSQPSQQHKGDSNAPRKSGGNPSSDRDASSNRDSSAKSDERSSSGGAGRQGSSNAPSSNPGSQKSGDSRSTQSSSSQSPSRSNDRGARNSQTENTSAQRSDANKRSPSFDDDPERGGKGGNANTSIEGGSGTSRGPRQRNNLPQYGDAMPGDPRRSHVEADGQGDSSSVNPGSEMGSESLGAE
jgi:hypothetical protein